MVHAKKSLGQNFLNSKAVARDIVRAAELSPTDTVLEIGPGKGFLTSELLASGARVIAVEKDDRMIPILSEKFANEIAEKQFVLIHGDIIEIMDKHKVPTFGCLCPRHESADSKFLRSDLGDSQYKLVANIPYYLTGQIIRIFLEAGRASTRRVLNDSTRHDFAKSTARHDFAKSKPERMILMVQKEVATRIVARDKKESILSIAVKAYGTPRLIKKVPARYFTPSPKVDSAILAIENISNKNFPDKESDKYFFEIVRAGFAHKRKVLAGNLKELFGSNTIQILSNVGVVEKARAEDLTLEQWLAITSKCLPCLSSQ